MINHFGSMKHSIWSHTWYPRTNCSIQCSAYSKNYVPTLQNQLLIVLHLLNRSHPVSQVTLIADLKIQPLYVFAKISSSKSIGEPLGSSKIESLAWPYQRITSSTSPIINLAIGHFRFFFFLLAEIDFAVFSSTDLKWFFLPCAFKRGYPFK